MRDLYNKQTILILTKPNSSNYSFRTCNLIKKSRPVHSLQTVRYCLLYHIFFSQIMPTLILYLKHSTLSKHDKLNPIQIYNPYAAIYMNTSQITDIIYHQDFDTRKGNIIEVTDDFLQYIDRNGSLHITGDHEDDMILSTDDKTYKLRGINLPTTLLILSQEGKINFELSHFLKLQDYDHQYHRIYKKIKNSSPQEEEFDTLSLQQLIEKYGIEDDTVRDKFKISLKEFKRFQEFVDFIYHKKKRLFIPVTLLLKYMRNLMIFLNQNQLINKNFTLKQLHTFSPQINCFNQFIDGLFLLVARRFHFETVENQQKEEVLKMEIEGQQSEQKTFKLTYESIMHFIILELALAKNQYVASQMDELVKDMLNVYVPIGMQTPSQEEKKSLNRRVISSYFIETTRNNTQIRIYYDPLEIESSLKGRIKFMATFKNKFTRDEIRGVFEGMVIQDASKEIKQVGNSGRKSIDMDDLLLKNFRRYNQLYQIKLILPK